MTKVLLVWLSLISLLLTQPISLHAQTNNQTNPAINTTTSTVLPFTKSAPGALYNDFVAQDIETSRIEELSQWALSLGLSSKGSLAELKLRLLNHYKTLQAESDKLLGESGKSSTTSTIQANSSPDLAASAAAEKNISIKIERSGSAEYFSMESTGDDLVKLSSGVLLVLRDSADGLEHKIQADEITINRKTKELNARGKVVYQQGAQTFSGEEMLFFPENQNTMLIDATGERGQNLGGTEAQFRIKGHVLNRLLKEIIILEEAYLSSSIVNPDAYHIRANRIWILSSGEWAIDSMILYVGTIPVFFFPFFYMPPDELIFNPAIGTKTIEGWSLQTTWYLFGKKPESKKPLSFLNLDFDDNTDYDVVPHGLFLKRVPKKSNTANPQATSQLTASNLKFMLDYYTRLGFFVGMNLNSKGDVFTALDINLGFAFSRRIYQRSGAYSSFYEDPNSGELREYWDKGYFAGQELPFRYFLDVKTGIQVKGLNNATISVDLPLRSDPYVIDDFLKDRAENIDWEGLLNIDTVGQETTNSAATINNADPIFKISSTTLVIPVTGLNPIVTSFNITSPEIRWDWKVKNVVFSDLPLEIQESYNSSESAFYAPSLLTLPSFGLSIAGKLLQLPYQSPNPIADTIRQAKSPYLVPGANFSDLEKKDQTNNELPANQVNPNESLQASDDNQTSLQLSDRLVISQATLLNNQVTLDIGYSFVPKFKLLADFPLSNSTSPLDVQYLIQKWSYDLSSVGSLSLGLNLPYKILSYNAQLRSESYQREFFAPDASLSSAELLAFTKLDFDARYLNLNQENRVALSPFSLIPELSSSDIYYEFNYTLLKQRFIESSNSWVVNDIWFNGQQTFLSKHEIGANLQFNSGLVSTKLTSSYQLPTKTEAWVYGFNFNLKSSPTSGNWFETSLAGSVNTPRNNWQAQAMTITANFNALNDLYLRNSLVYSPNMNQVTTINNTLKIGPIDFALESTLSKRKVFDNLLTIPDWVDLDLEPFLQPSKIRTGLTLELTPPDLWEGRIRQETISLILKYDQDLLQVTDGLIFTYSFNYKAKIFEFLDFTFQLSGGNKNFYRYFPGFAESVGVEPLDFFDDLWKGINIFDTAGLEETSFKLNSIFVSLTHDVGDWYVQLQLNTKPLLETKDGVSSFVWDSTLSLFIIWKPIEELKKKFEIKKDVWSDVSGQ